MTSSVPSSLSRSQPENIPCRQKPMTKAALFVISLLFAGGAVASQFAGLGIPGIVAFSVAGGVCLIAFVVSCLCFSQQVRGIGSSNPSRLVPDKVQVNDPAEDYKKVISSIRTKVRSVNDTNSEYWEITSYIQKFYANSEAMNYLVQQYQGFPKLLGMWVAKPLEPMVVDKKYDAAPNKALFAVLRRYTEIFRSVIHYWFVEDGGVPVGLFDETITFDHISAIVNEALRSDESIETLIWNLIEARYLYQHQWVREVNLEAIKVQQSLMLGMMAVQKPHLVRQIIANNKGQQAYSSDPRTLDTLIVDGLKEANVNKCLTDEELKAILDK